MRCLWKDSLPNQSLHLLRTGIAYVMHSIQQIWKTLTECRARGTLCKNFSEELDSEALAGVNYDVRALHCITPSQCWGTGLSS
jgi:hypothetical protein